MATQAKPPHDEARAFEREKWQAELKLRERELDLKEREQKWSRRLRLLALVVLALGLAAIAGAGVALINAQAARTAAVQAPAARDVAQCPPPDARPNLGFAWLNVSCRYRFPPNDGFKGEPQDLLLAAGTVLDRYGQPGGTFVSPAGASYESRALPYDQAKMDYYRYEVVRPFTVKAGEAVPWFDQAGGGMQYKTDRPVRQLVIEGTLRQVGSVPR
jgi:nicrotizing toxin Mtb-like protein